MEPHTKIDGPTKVDELVDYQDHSIVSRTILDKATGSVTVFAFDTGQGLSEHTTPFDALVQILEGDAAVVISDQTFYPTAGDLLLMPANHPHALKAVTPFKMMLTMIKS
jgi:quercetin dioxygenase-like cupin family protein